ncbi:flavin-containing monooxygenase [Rhodococcus opacus]|uniref:flavin-containing monooxygenase n=1 Tax=Rhodococcus opacus TaxID=37919 RepID=UPI0022362DB7|nr:NAD(P)/FAD-dependent oxidoreductase [Rhodococcus opacus]UZG59897.1 NAD(P)/FAD-dependent oxidoreductase [Rhodococcus opacus]
MLARLLSSSASCRSWPPVSGHGLLIGTRPRTPHACSAGTKRPISPKQRPCRPDKEDWKSEKYMSHESDVDVVIIGAGFAGVRMLVEAKRQGLTARLFEAGSDVGGAWYWNKYPGARTDSESWVYCFGFDKDLQDEWDWPERYPNQPQVQAYIKHVVERFDVGSSITFNARVESSVFDEDRDLWTTTTDTGETLVSRFLVSATGPLSAPLDPPYPGLADFRGDWYLTARWPDEKIDFTGKRVGVIGTGASGIQVTPLVAAVADHLTVFQRTANYAIPARNYVLDDLQRQSIKARYDDIWEQVSKQAMGMAMNPANRVNGDVTEEERDKLLEAAWEEGGFRFFLETFDDVFYNPESNAAVSEFVRNKIRTIVKDPATAELLCPKPDHPIGAKRPPLENFYYQAFNRPNVDLVDVSDNAIADVSENGIRLTDGTEVELDVIIFATGFDALTGALTRIDVRGRGGVTLAEKWADGPRTHLAMTVDEFPNFFMIAGPQIPFANAPAMVEPTVETISQAIATLEEQGLTRVEVDPAAVEEYNELLSAYYNATIFPAGAKLRAWWLGTNVSGKKLGVAMNFGGYPTWVNAVKAEAAEGFQHYTFSSAPDAELSSGSKVAVDAGAN